MPRVESWSQVPASAFAAVVAAEQERWRDEFHWETGELWATVEQARLDGRLPGVVTRADDGTVTGFTYWTARQGEVHCGALTASSPGGTAVLLDALLAASRSQDAAPIRLFASTSAPGLDHLLLARGFEAGPYAYLASAASAADRTRPIGRGWDIRDLDATVELLRAGYAGADAGRPFAPRGTAAEWRQYASELVLGHGCGRFRSTLSVALPGDHGALEAVALVTDIGAGSAHLAQLVVHPAAQGSGVATRIVDTARAWCAAAGYRRLTLLVREGNRAAERLYARLGFARRGVFTSAVRRATAGRETGTAAAAATGGR